MPPREQSCPENVCRGRRMRPHVDAHVVVLLSLEPRTRKLSPRFHVTSDMRMALQNQQREMKVKHEEIVT
jgi:hypothetical protein